MSDWMENTAPNIDCRTDIRIADPAQARTKLAQNAYVILEGTEFQISEALEESRSDFWQTWNRLEKDNYLKGDYQFRYRRYGRFSFSLEGGLRVLPHAPFFQSRENNSYAGGIAREFAPLEIKTIRNRFLEELIALDFTLLPLEMSDRLRNWELDLHQYRIIGSNDWQGEPTPEGIHHDGFDYFAVHMVEKKNASGGLSTIYDINREPIESLTLERSMDTMIVEDRRVMHAVTPIKAINASLPAVRDVMVINFIKQPRKLPMDSV